MPGIGPTPPVTSFINGGAFMPIATLMADYPAGSDYLGNYARVTDLWGNVRSVMICEYDGTTYYWRPQRTDYATNNNATSGSMTLTPLVTAPVQFLTGTLLGNMTLTPSATNAWPGAQFTINMNGALGIFGVTLNGLIGGGTLSVLLGGSRTVTYTSAGWRGA